MARKYSVIEADGRPGAQMKKSAAQLLVRRLLAVEVAPFTIRKLRVSEQPTVLPKTPAPQYVKPRPEIQHHIEPRIYELSWENSEWLAYLHGYDTCSSSDMPTTASD